MIKKGQRFVIYIYCHTTGLKYATDQTIYKGYTAAHDISQDGMDLLMDFESMDFCLKTRKSFYHNVSYIVCEENNE